MAVHRTLQLQRFNNHEIAIHTSAGPSLGDLYETVRIGGRGGGGGRVRTILPASTAHLQLVGPEEAHAMVAPPLGSAVGKPNLKVTIV